MLKTLERDNLFIVPLDNKHQWYRYYHLFADVLQTRLIEELPTQLATLHQRASTWMVVVDEAQFRTLPAMIALVSAQNTQAQGHIPNTVKFADLTLKLSPEEEHSVYRAQAAVLLGFTYWASGDLEAAHKAMSDWINNMQKAGNLYFVIASAFALAEILVDQGQLHETVRTYQNALQLASEQDNQVQRVISHLYLGLAMLYHEMDDQEEPAKKQRVGSTKCIS